MEITDQEAEDYIASAIAVPGFATTDPDYWPNKIWNPDYYLGKIWDLHEKSLEQFDICIQRIPSRENYRCAIRWHRETLLTVRLYFKLGGNNHNETETLQRIDAKCIPEIVRVLADYKATIPAKKQRRQEAGVACKKARGIIIIRDAGRCGICGRFVASMNVSIDHIKPVILGGTDEMDNLQLAHRRCNSRKRMRYGANV